MIFDKHQQAEIRSRIALAISQLKHAEAQADLGQFVDAETTLKRMDDILLPIHQFFEQDISPDPIAQEYQEDGLE